MGPDAVKDVRSAYDKLSKTYEEKYVAGGLDNKYMIDEWHASEHFARSGITGNIVSLGVGSGQDIEILGHPHHEQFTGYDISKGMLENGRAKFSRYSLLMHDCTQMIPDKTADVLVSMFGAANYLGADKLIEHYEWLGCHAAFFVFYNETYDDDIYTEYHVYDRERLEVEFSRFGATVAPLFDGSNYYVVWWNEDH